MHIHFIGIGGIGVSALAQFFLSKGYHVSGSDLNNSEIINLLKKKGAKIKIGKHSASNLLNKTKLVVYSPAVHLNNPEIKKAKKMGIKIQSYPQALGELTKQFFTIAIAGTHGKSTTTSMLALIMINAGLDPTVIIGTKLKEFGNSNFRAGKSKYLLIEADEYQGSFLNYFPKIITITNIEKDHLDYFKNINHILRIFKSFVKKADIIIANRDDENIKKIISSKMKVRYFGFPPPKELKLKVPGNHNLYNALGAMTTAFFLGIKKKNAIKSLKKFQGAWRRFEIIKADTNIIVSDYGHHPTEVKKTLLAAREKFKSKKIICIFQPHQYERTALLFNDFIEAFKKLDINKIIILDIYEVAGREGKNIKRKINSEKLVKAINNPNVIYVKKEDEALKIALKTMGVKGVLIIMGAGNIHNNLFLKAFKTLTKKRKKMKLNLVER